MDKPSSFPELVSRVGDGDLPSTLLATCDDPERDKWLADIASKCHARNKPCGGCQQGAGCDGVLGGGRYEDDQDDEDDNDGYPSLLDVVYSD